MPASWPSCHSLSSCSLGRQAVAGGSLDERHSPLQPLVLSGERFLTINASKQVEGAASPEEGYQDRSSPSSFLAPMGRMPIISDWGVPEWQGYEAVPRGGIDLVSWIYAQGAPHSHEPTRLGGWVLSALLPAGCPVKGTLQGSAVAKWVLVAPSRECRSPVAV